MPVINTNTAANSALRYLNINSRQQASSTSKIASGSRINKPSDDAAGLAVATDLKSDITALDQANKNASQASSILQIVDGALDNISSILQRMKSLATQSNSGAVSDDQREYLQAEFAQLQDEIDGIAEGTRYNGQCLLRDREATQEEKKAVQDAKDALAAAAPQALKDAQKALGKAQDKYNDKDKAVTDARDALAGASTKTASLQLAVSAALQARDGGEIGTPSATSGAYKSATTSTITSGTAGASSSTVAIADSAKGKLDAAKAKVEEETEKAASEDQAYAAAKKVYDRAVKSAGVHAAFEDGVDFMVGTTTRDTIDVTVGAADTDALNVKRGSVSVETQEEAQKAVATVSDAITAVSKQRAEVGASMSRFAFRKDTIESSRENIDAAKSVITDVDIAAEQAKLSAAEVKTQAAVAALASANRMPQNLLTLLR